MKKPVLIMILILLSFVLAACAAGPNPLRNTENEDGDVAGFWKG